MIQNFIFCKMNLDTIMHLSESDDLADKHLIATQILNDKEYLATLIFQKLKFHTGFKIRNLNSFEINIQENVSFEGEFADKFKSLIIGEVVKQPIEVLLGELGLTEVNETIKKQLEGIPSTNFDYYDFTNFSVKTFLERVEFATGRSKIVYDDLIGGLMDNLSVVLTQENKDQLKPFIKPINLWASHKHLYPLLSKMYGGRFVTEVFMSDDELTAYIERNSYDDESNSTSTSNEPEDSKLIPTKRQPQQQQQPVTETDVECSVTFNDDSDGQDIDNLAKFKKLNEDSDGDYGCLGKLCKSTD
jgi:hypothetical protein